MKLELNEEIIIDEDTGLPKLPEKFSWLVYEVKNRYRDLDSNKLTCKAYSYITIVYTGSFLEKLRKFFTNPGSMNSIESKEFNDFSDDEVFNAALNLYKDIVYRQQQKAAKKRLVGLFPPNKISS